MSIFRLVTAAVTLAIGVVAMDASPAAACSCAADRETEMPLSFDGRALGPQHPAGIGTVWAFEVIDAARGTERGDRIEVALDVDPLSEGGLASTSSCSLGSAPAVGELYRVTAYDGTSEDGSRQFFANLCGGSLTAVMAADSPNDRADSLSPVAGNDLSWQFAALVGLVVAGAVAVVLIHRTRRANG